MANHLECDRCGLQLPHIRALLEHYGDAHPSAVTKPVDLTPTRVDSHWGGDHRSAAFRASRV